MVVYLDEILRQSASIPLNVFFPLAFKIWKVETHTFHVPHSGLGALRFCLSVLSVSLSGGKKTLIQELNIYICSSATPSQTSLERTVMSAKQIMNSGVPASLSYSKLICVSTRGRSAHIKEKPQMKHWGVVCVCVCDFWEKVTKCKLVSR